MENLEVLSPAPAAEVVESKGKKLIKVPISRIGSWEHPKYGQVVEDQKDFDQIISNWESGVLGYEPPLYLGHPNNVFSSGGTPAVAFLDNIVQEGEALFGLYDPVDEQALNDVESGKYRYASPELARNAVNRENGEKVGTVLERHALTNEPFFTKLPRVEVVEVEAFTQPTETVRFVFTQQSTISKEEEVFSQPSIMTTTSTTPTTTPAAEQSSTAPITNTEVNEQGSVQAFSGAVADPAADVETLKEENLVLRQELADRDRKYSELLEKFSNLETTLNEHTETFRRQETNAKLQRLNKLNISAETKELYTNKLNAGMSPESEEMMWQLLNQLSTSEAHKFTNVNGAPTAKSTTVEMTPYLSTLERLKQRATDLGREFNLPV
jgi:hypothetical protein